MQEARLGVAVGPIHGLGCTDAGQLDIVCDVHAAVDDQSGFVVQFPIETSFPGQFGDVEVAAVVHGIGYRHGALRGLHFADDFFRLEVRLEMLPVVALVVLACEFEADSVVKCRSVPEGYHGNLAFTARQGGAGAFGTEGGFGDDVKDTVRAVGAVQGGAGPKYHFHLFDVFVGRGDKIIGIEAQGGHAGDAVVGQG